ncbi:MAG: hypothetical protein QOF45_653 [Gaiellaceae bacterium]|jgi:hypothetical protein|nr:hypothetical protein [Gaiellaceae bacterium]
MVKAVMSAQELTRNQLIRQRTLFLPVFGGIAALVIYLGMDAPTWALVAAVFAGAAGVPVGVWLANRQSHGGTARASWPLWVAVGASGVLLVDAPDHVMVICIAFVAVFAAVLIIKAELPRRRTSGTA